MIQVAPNRSQNDLIALAVLGIVGVLFLATYRPLPAEPVSTADASQAAVTSGSEIPGPSPTRPLLPNPTPRVTPRPTQAPCVLPESLPSSGVTAAIPKIEGKVGSILFASPTYLTGAPSPIAADTSGFGWNMGLWFVPRPGAAPTLVLSAGPGMVYPLALSPNGRMAAVWWWPERRGATEAPCEQGIYTIDLAQPTESRLVERGDWAERASDEGSERSWLDTSPHFSGPLEFSFPDVRFSADGSYVAVAEGDRIVIHNSMFPADMTSHVGVCPTWSWGPTDDRFVAGCEDMTSAWTVKVTCCDAGLDTRSLPIPSPPPARFSDDWEVDSNRAIGFTKDGDIRVARAYGFATGCEGEGECHIPPPAWSTTTIDWDTGSAVHEGDEVTFLFDTETRLSAAAGWFYGTSYDESFGAVTVEFSTGTVRHLPPLGIYAGSAADGSAIYGLVNPDRGPWVIQSLSVRSMVEAATIRWPDGAVAQTEQIPVLGLWVGAPT